MKKVPRENNLLLKVVADTLGKFALMYGDSVDRKDIKCDCVEYITAKTAYINDSSGAVLISVPSEFCSYLVNNVLGTDEKDEFAFKNRFDAIKEFANVVAGQYVLELFGPGKKTTLQSPEIINLSSKGWHKAIDSAEVLFLVDDMPMLAEAIKGK